MLGTGLTIHCTLCKTEFAIIRDAYFFFWSPLLFSILSEYTGKFQHEVNEIKWSD